MKLSHSLSAGEDRWLESHLALAVCKHLITVQYERGNVKHTLVALCTSGLSSGKTNMNDMEKYFIFSLESLCEAVV